MGEQREQQAGRAEGPRLLISGGALEAEDRLLEAVVRHADRVRAEPDTLLGRPFRIVVPSRSLRDHLGAAMMARLGRPLVGVSVQTLHAVALEIVERSGGCLPGGQALFPVVVRQHARGQSALRESLDGLADGYGIVEAGVADLLDAGFEAHHVEPLCELLAEAAIGRSAAAHGRALVRVAAGVLGSLEGGGAGHRSQLLRSAAEALVGDPDQALPSSELWVHGFADATGVATDLIRSLVRDRAGQVLLAEGLGQDGRSFSAHFRSEVESVASVIELPREGHAPSGALRLLEAPGASAESRAVALLLQQRLAEGACPERIGVVARDLGEYVQPLRVHLRRLGVPFSGGATPGPGGARTRRLEASLSLLRNGPRTPIDVWLDALSNEGVAASLARHHADLRLALRCRGAARLADAVRLEASQQSVRLPVRSGVVESADEASAVAPGRRLRAAIWNDALERVRDIVDRAERWPGRAPLGDHLAALEATCDALGWPDEDRVRAALHAGLRDLSPDFPLTHEDFLLLVGRGARRFVDEPIGGAGGGVQILTVMEARGRTFDHLFVLGLNRDLFPRVVTEDPLLPDSVRGHMRTLIPDLPVKAVGHAEERHLFEQLLASSGDVTLSWQSCADDGKPRSPSTLVERLRRLRPDLEVEAVGTEPAPPAPETAAGVVRPAREHALYAALHEGRERFSKLLPLALGPLAEAAVLDADRLARARLAIVTELDLPPARAPRPLGPYYGFVGPVREAADLRRQDLFVTALEQTARCPWRYFVEKLLRVEAPPDPSAALPDVDAALLGNAVHRVLERIALPVTGEGQRLEALADAPPHVVPWPDDETLRALVLEVSRELVTESGTWLPGLANVLARRAWPLIQRARELEWPAGDAREDVLGAEVRGVVGVPVAAEAGEVEEGEEIPRQRAEGPSDEIALYFVADRVDRADGAAVLTDYKTGKPPSTAAKSVTRRTKLRAGVREGKLLQAAAYAHASGGRGRYTYLRPEDPEEHSRYEISASDDDFRDAFEQAVGVLLRARREGVFFPRLSEDTERSQDHPQCRLCPVAQACLHGDSGAKRRLVEWVEAARAGGAPATPGPAAHRALLALFDLGRVDKSDGAAS